MSTYRDNAVVLGSHKFGEADRVVVLLTQEHGKVRAVAKGVRKTKSSIGARLEPMSHVDVSLRTGKDLDTVSEVRLLHTHSALRTDFDRLNQGLSMYKKPFAKQLQILKATQVLSSRWLLITEAEQN